MARADLQALTDDGLTQLSNAGTVKRALREIASGAGPQIAELPDGTMEARFADRTLTRLPPGRPLAEASCTCPSSGMCRHRVMLALGCREPARKETEAAPAEAWSPAALDAASFEAGLTPAAKAELARLLTARHPVRLDHGKTPSAHLPMACVRFLVPGDPSYARCDCAQGQFCAHVALAIRAFRAAQGAGETVVGGTREDAIGGPGREGDRQALREACDGLIGHLLLAGVTAGPAAHAQWLDRARGSADRLGASQVLLAIDALAAQIKAYEMRSARYDERVVLGLAVELQARTRAGDAVAALGLGEPFETPMAKSRLVSLGARLRQEGADIRVAILFADSDTGVTLLLDKAFSPLPSETGTLLASVPRRRMGPGLPVAGTARGQVLTSVARRRADGLLALGGGAGGRTQVLPRDAMAAFPPPLAARGVAEVAAAMADRPLAPLRPRRLTESVHVFDIDEVLGQSWAAGDQLWQAAVRVAGDGGTLYLERAFDAAAPAAPAVLAEAFGGRWGHPRQVAGPLRRQGGVLVCEPWSVSADRFIVPDLETLDEVATVIPPPPPPPRPDLLDEAGHLLSGAIHAGARGGESRRALGTSLLPRLTAAGYRTLSERLSLWLADGDTQAFGAAGLWLLALQDCREAGSL